MASEETMRRVLKMQFVDGMSDVAIAEVFASGKQRANARTVGGIVNEAVVWLMNRDKRLAELELEATPERLLAAELREKAKLKAVRIISGGEIKSADDKLVMSRRYGAAAAAYFDEIASGAEDRGEDLHVAVSGNQTILNMVLDLPERRRANVTFYSSAIIGHGKGPMTSKASHVGPETNATVAWAKSGRIAGHLFYGTVQPYDLATAEYTDLKGEKRHEAVKSLIMAQREEFMQLEQVQATLDVMDDKINMAIVGLGIVNSVEKGPQNERTMTGLLEAIGIDLGVLARQGAVGDIGYSLFDAEGQGNPEWHFFITAGDSSEAWGVDFYRQLVREGNEVVVCEGYTKEAALRVAIKFKLINVLITDMFTAKRLLSGAPLTAE